MPNKLTLEQFIIRASKIHDNKYNYSKFIYIGSNDKGIIICPEHGEFLQAPAGHLRGYRCKKCSNDIKNHKNKLGLNKFIIRATETHDNKYDYSKFIYINSKIKGIIICPIHGEFEQCPSNHMRGSGCFKCFCSSLDDFVKKTKVIHDDKYDYSKFIYINNKIKGIIICPIHGEFSQAPSDHLAKHGCPKCKADNSHNILSLGVEEFIRKANLKHFNKYNYEKFIYINNSTKGIIMCPKHGEFLQTPGGHLRGYGCNKCSHTYSKKCNNWVCSFNNINIIKGYRIKIKGRWFEFDGFDPTTNTIYEFYGDLFHGNPNIYNHADKIYYGKTFGELYQKTIKRELFLKNAGFKMIIIWESEFDKINKKEE